MDEMNEQPPFCGLCGSKSINTTETEIVFSYGRGSTPIELKAIVPVRNCLNCGDVFLDAEADDRKQQAVLKHITPPNEVMLQWADECKLQPFEEEERLW